MATIDDIRLAFQNILQRSGTEVSDAELNSYVSAVNSGALTLAQARAALINSPEGQDVQDVVRLYQVVFGRVPDQAGLNFQVDALRGPANEQNIAEGFAASPEFAARFGGNTVNTAFINAVYQQVLGRAPAASEVDFYLNSGFSAARIALAFSEAPEFRRSVDTAVSNFLDAAGQGTATYTGSLGGATNPGATFAFTAGIDALSGTAGNDTFVGDYAVTNQVTAADSVNGGAGVDTLNLFGATGTATLPQLSGVEVVNFTAPAGDVTANVASITDVTTVGLTNTATAAGTFTVNATQGASFSGVTGGKTHTVTTTATDTAVTVNVAASTLGTLNVDGAALTTIDLNATGTGASTIGTLASTGTETTVTVSGTQKLTVTNALADSVKTVNAAANSGGVTFTVGTSDASVTGGSGNDRFVFGTTLTTADTVVGGAGTDTIAVAGADYSTVVANGTLAALNSKVTGFEVLEFTGATATTISGTTFTNTEITKLLFNTTAADTINSAGSTRTYAFGELNTDAATINTGADVKSVNVALEGITGNGGDVGALTVNFTNNTAAQVGTGTINIASTGVNDAANPNTITSITGQSNTGALTTTSVVVTGSHDLTVGSVGTAANVNASAFTGKLVITGSAAQDIIVGGAGADTINATAGADTYAGGAGVDTFKFTALGQASANNLTTIADFTSGTDKLDVSGLSTAAGTFNATAVNVAAAPDFAGALNLAAAGNGGAAGVTTYFQFGGNTFVVVDNGAGAAFDSTTDAVIKLTGVVTLTATDVIA
ncbi:DUF4214 domain-containing protein [Antarcticirhabdus aurantiaca]|uniref:DUF4214 domain-containing protein n=1 Tax=Antarcticirhabdus aurantiaca TaxID=2606717 RepID=A0ACD4NTB7_9HYPH|nr:DUF4214 domain-containing protein [Antarcticirhabdus aurantiaca]WAJ29951.1 DUF4214 domain-containing protein [Jeongeuplla avenae]